MQNRTLALGLGGVLLAAVGAALFAAGPTFEARDFELRVGTFGTSTDIAYEGRRPKREHEVTMKEVFITHDKRVDAVCVSDELGAVGATGDRGEKMLAKTTGTGKKFCAFGLDSREAKTELRKAALTGNPYLVEQMQVDASIITAERRETVDLPPEVSSEPVRGPGGMSLRMQLREIKETGDAKITIVYTRPDAAGAAFLEKIELVGKSGAIMGGGRWTEGDPFGDKGTWESKFHIKRGEVLDRVRCYILLRYDIETVKFKVTDIFQE